MPAYKDDDNLDCWVLGALTEQYEGGGDEELRQRFFKMLLDDDMIKLEDEVEIMLESVFTNDIFMRAVMNTINFKKLMAHLNHWAIDYCAKCYEYHAQCEHECTSDPEKKTCRQCKTTYPEEAFDTEGKCEDCRGQYESVPEND